MKPIHLPVAELKPALNGLGKIINLKSAVPILLQVKVERTSEGWIALTATDLDRFVTVRFEHPSEGPPLAVLIPFDQLAQITKKSGRDESLIVEVHSPTDVMIRFALADNLGGSKVKALPIEEFPTTPRIKADGIPLPAEIRRSIREAMDCASVDSTRYILNGTFIDTSNPKACYIVGTDGKHLYSANSFTLPLRNSVIIPSHKFLGWKEFNLDGEWQIKADEVAVQLSTRRWRFISKQIEGNYPNWRQTIPNPNEAKTRITINPDKLEDINKLIQRIPCHDSDKFNTIGLEWKQGQFLLLGKDSPEEPWTRVPVLDVKGEGPEVTIFINRRFLTKAFDYGLNAIALINDISCLRFHNLGKQMIVMPLRPEGANPQPPAVTVIHSSPSASTPPHKTMISSPTPEAPPPHGPKTAVEEAIDMTLQIRDKLNEGFNLLRDLSIKLKGINRDHKNSAKDLQSVRSTLRQLQVMKF